MFKKILVLITVILVLASISSQAADKYGGYNIPVDIDINGSFIKCVRKPILVEGKTYIPLRSFSDVIGGSLKWDDENMVAVMKKSGHKFEFYPGKSYSYIDGVKKSYPSIIYKNLTFIPVRAVSEVLDYDVEWDELYLTVKISAPDVEVPKECKDKSYSYDDIKYLGRIIRIESGYQHFEVKLGVGRTIINRVKSSQFPDNIKDVIFDTKYGVQFPPAHTENFRKTPTKECIIAAKCVLNGVNIVGNSLYFIDTAYASSSWAHNNRPHYKNIHDMSFYE